MQGASSLRIIVKSIMPMCLPSVLVRITLSMATVILTAAGLGFLGLGAQPPLPEWGAMIATGRRYMLDSWWLVAIPGRCHLDRQPGLQPARRRLARCPRSETALRRGT